MSDPRNDAHAKKVTQGRKKKPGPAAAESAVLSEVTTPQSSPALEGSLAVLAKLKDLEFHSRAHLQRLAELGMTVEDELKQKDLAASLSDVYAAQNVVQTTLITLIEAYRQSATACRVDARHGRTRMKIFVSLAGVIVLAAACGDSHGDATDLQAQKAQLERELEGLRQSAALISRGESLIPASNVVVAIQEALVQRLIARRLPIDIVAAPYRIALTAVEVGFNGAPTVELRGMVTRDGLPGISVAAKLIGALSGIEVDTTTFTLRARIAADHLDIESTAGLGALFSGSSLHDVAEMLRLELVAQLPVVEIPVRVQEDILIPAVTDGPVQMAAVRFPVKASVSRVFAANGRLWIGLHVEVTQPAKGAP